MRDDSPQWRDVGEPATPVEAEALRAIKAMLPDGGLCWAWSNLSFIDMDGQLHETDLLLLTQHGLALVELKGWSGRISGGQRRWLLGRGEVENPRFRNEAKARKLKGHLESLLGRDRRLALPWIEAIICLHGQGCTVALDEASKKHLYGLDGYGVAGVPLLSTFLGQPARGRGGALDQPQCRAIAALINNAGFEPPPRVRMVGPYAVDQLAPESQGPTWVDVIAENPHLVGLRKRIRLFNVPRGASEEGRAQIWRAAQRELRLTTGLSHPGVIGPSDISKDDQGRPALVFDFDPAARRLDDWLADHDNSLLPERRFEVIRRLGEILQYAHNRGVTHRALTPHQVYVVDEPGKPLLVTVRDWQTGRVSPDLDQSAAVRQTTLLQGTRNFIDLADQDTWVYLAPEVHMDEPDGVALDVYGLGALGYLLLTSSPPANSIAELEQRIRGSKGLDPAVEIDGVTEGFRRLVMRATHPDARLERTASASEFLHDLDTAIEDWKSDAEPVVVVDPLEADTTDVLTEDLIVEARLGSGSTGVALLVSNTNPGAPLGSEALSVLKVAHDAAKAPRLQDEYEALQSLDSPRIVRALGPPFDINGRRCIQLEDAGRPTLGARIRDVGRLTLDQLAQYGADLLEAAAHMDSRGVLQRDIKPDNLGVRPDTGDRRPRLVLFDFSLTREPLDHIHAGTQPYLDPFLGGGRRPRYDRAAERFAITVTLYEMATGTRPVWGSGDAHPAAIDDEVTLVELSFEPAVAASMMTFFRKALARDAGRRFGDLSELAQAWAAIFVATERTTYVEESDDDTLVGPVRHVDVTQTTPLTESGLSARAQSAFAQLQVTTVGEALSVPANRVNFIPGAGERTKREMRQALRDWRRTLASPAAAGPTSTGQQRPSPASEGFGSRNDAEEEGAAPGRGVDALVMSLMPGSSGRNQAQITVARILLGLESPAPQGFSAWPNLSDISRHLGVTRPAISQVLDRLRPAWLRKTTDERLPLTNEVLDIVDRQGGIAEVSEIARTLLATRGSAAFEPERTRQAIGVVRAVLEADESLGGDARLTSRRVGDRVIVALEPQDPNAPSAEAALDYARLLAAEADRLAAGVPVPLRATVLAALRSIPLPPGVPALPDDRLASLAAAASATAARGGRGEIYARGLEAAEALRLTLAGAAVSRMHLTPQTLEQKVAARFPLAAPLPSRPALDDLVLAAEPSLAWDGTAYVAPTSTSGWLLPTQHGFTTQHGSTTFGIPAETQPYDEIDARLQASLRSSGYLTLAVDPRRVDQAAAVLASTYGLTRVDVTAELLAAVKDHAAEVGADWATILDADKDAPGTRDRSLLDSFVKAALDRRLPGLLTRPDALLLTDASILGRYGQQHWLAHLADLAAIRPAARWLLVPHHDSGGQPTLDSSVPAPLGADGWIVINGGFIAARQPSNETIRPS